MFKNELNGRSGLGTLVLVMALYLSGFCMLVQDFVKEPASVESTDGAPLVCVASRDC